MMRKVSLTNPHYLRTTQAAEAGGMEIAISIKASIKNIKFVFDALDILNILIVSFIHNIFMQTKLAVYTGFPTPKDYTSVNRTSQFITAELCLCVRYQRIVVIIST